MRSKPLGSEADAALRAALPKVKADTLIGVINSIGKRQDENAVDALTKLTNSAEPNVARAAASALGHISGLRAADSLQRALGTTEGPVRTAVAVAGLVCAERLLARGEHDRGMALYNALVATDIQKPVRLAAMHGIIAAETSISRPR
jgi:HEAT repeat protein